MIREKARQKTADRQKAVDRQKAADRQKAVDRQKKPKTNPAMLGQQYPSSLDSSTCNIAQGCADLPPVRNTNHTDTSTGFLRIQSPNSINAKNMANQKEHKPLPSFQGIYESLNKEISHPLVSNNTLVFDTTTLYQHTTTVSYDFRNL